MSSSIQQQEGDHQKHNNVLFTTNKSRTGRQTLYILVIAHPDDESMFFVPTIRSLMEKQQKVWILCLTTGNYDGLGRIRQKELQDAGNLLGISKVICQDELQDHPSQKWDTNVVSTCIQQALIKDATIPVECRHILFLTFDWYGISGHVNHIDTHFGVKAFLQNQKKLFQSNATKTTEVVSFEAWELQTEHNLLYKYIPILSWILLLLSVLMPRSGASSTTTTPFHEGTTQYCFRWHEPTLNWKAMAAHQSQFVWYRRLFVIFSCYTYVNEFRLMGRCSAANNIAQNTKKIT